MDKKEVKCILLRLAPEFFWQLKSESAKKKKTMLAYVTEAILEKMKKEI